ncbi:hypothetical protein [Xenorhabdus santafensis]|uniref:hypothetical protein n=1 Tax=Xenorhabdus santafensis TaxID=2582833 RepID=UPI0029E7CBA4|nr:hypothetical protein [Xenorhabdus sp. 12]
MMEKRIEELERKIETLEKQLADVQKSVSYELQDLKSQIVMTQHGISSRELTAGIKCA